MVDLCYLLRPCKRWSLDVVRKLVCITVVWHLYGTLWIGSFVAFMSVETCDFVIQGIPSTMVRVRLYVLFFPFRDTNLKTATARERQAQLE
jgi:hypothetical protein